MDLKKIKKLALSATSGPWNHAEDMLTNSLHIQFGEMYNLNDAEYIASVSPDVVLKMIAKIEAADALASLVNETGDSHYKYCDGNNDCCLGDDIIYAAKKYRELCDLRNAGKTKGEEGE